MFTNISRKISSKCLLSWPLACIKWSWPIDVLFRINCHNAPTFKLQTWDFARKFKSVTNLFHLVVIKLHVLHVLTGKIIRIAITRPRYCISLLPSRLQVYLVLIFHSNIIITLTSIIISWIVSFVAGT